MGAIMSPTGRENYVVLAGNRICLEGEDVSKQLELGEAVAKEYEYEDWEGKKIVRTSHYIMKIRGGEVSLGQRGDKKHERALKEVLKLPLADRAVLMEAADKLSVSEALHWVESVMKKYPDRNIMEAAALHRLLESGRSFLPDAAADGSG